MKLLIQTILIGFSALGLAQLQNLPDCAKPCADSLPGQCHLDVSCICSDSAWITGISCCIATKCSASDQQKTLNVAVQLCDTVNVKLPSAASCPASASATAAASSAVAGGKTIASTGGISATTSVVSGAGTTSSTSASTATTTSATGSSSSMTGSTSSSATPASGAAQVLGSNIGAVGAAVAALALL